MYEAPQTDDGWIRGVTPLSPGKLEVTAEFMLPERFQERVRNRQEHIRFVARSRIARLGINITPFAPIEFRGRIASLRTTVEALVDGYAIGAHLEKMFLSGLRIGRLVFCDPGCRLTVDQVRQALLNHEFQLPVWFSLGTADHITLFPHRCVYDLQHPVSLQDLISIVARYDGNNVINRLQQRREVDRIIIEPGEAVITSCTAFLHKHFVLLDSRSATGAHHFESTVLDPVTTRGSRVYLEFYNRTQQKIMDPSVAVEIYSADDVPLEPRRWYGPGARPGTNDARGRERNRDYKELVRLYALSEQKSSPGSYLNRPVTVVTNIRKALSTNLPQAVWVNREDPRSAIAAAAARYLESGSSRAYYYDIEVLRHLGRRAGATVLLRYFPNVVEHIQLCRAASEGRVKRIVFREASFEHGPFLSAHDHGRLADYEALGVEVLWCNDIFKEVALHVYRGPRGFFVPLTNMSDFVTRLVIAVYGSTLPLSEKQYAPFKLLLEKLGAFFAGQVALLTGGGPGAMQQAADVGKALGLAVGCNFLEIVDQELSGSKDFYQTFQQSARHFRQRWFDISSFQLFCIGGLGTMEEIGLTLTDMKLSVMERGPLVFFGRHKDDLYWSGLREQLKVIVEEKRGPAWVNTHVLMTDDPDEVISFYERVLELGLRESPHNAFLTPDS